MANVDAPETHGTNPFVCNVCQKTYGRIDHLARHFRSHTNEKPFRCSDCGKTFARADLLKRHATLHTSTESSGKKRKIRASQACAACATIKVKCDQEKPCKRCLAKGLECRVEPTANSSTPRISEYSSPEDHNEHWTGQPSIHNTPRLPGPSASGNIPAPIQSYNVMPTQLSMGHMTNNPAPLVEDSSLTDFLSNVVHPGDSAHSQAQPRTDTTWNGNYFQRDLMDFSQDFGIDFHDFDAVLAGSWDNWLDPALMPYPTDKPTGQTVSDVSTPSIDDSINLSSAAYSRSAWRWMPKSGDEKRNEDQNFTSVLVDGHTTEHPHRPRQQTLVQPLDSSDRDRMVALLLASCERAYYQRIVASFPTLRVLDIFLNDFLLKMEHSLDGWIHIPSFKASEAIPELLIIMIAGGAVLSPSSQLQKLGYALQNKARIAIYEMFERDNSNTRSLQALQAKAICLGIGIWSGNKRTMELAEAGALPLTTMCRRQGAFRRSRGVAPAPAAEDTPEVLQQKWRTWVEAESFKRLAYHMFVSNVQVSVAFQTPPIMSYAEISLELPAPQALWRARSAEEWREQYRAHRMGQPLPTFVSSMCDAATMGLVRDKIDLELTLYLVLLSHWCLAWEYTQLSSANKAQPSGGMQWAGTVLASTKFQELCRLLDSFYMAIEDWKVFVPKEVHMSSQLLRMNLYVAFEDLQLIAGKEGEEEARRVLPSLKHWFRSPECREAIWHAGQVLRAARRPPGRSPTASRLATPNTPWLRDFHAVALYHAGLAFWAYGFLARAITAEQDHGAHSQRPSNWTPPIDYHGQLIRLDGDDEELTEIDRHHFIGLNKGRAVISTTSPFLREMVQNGQSIPMAAARTEASRASRGPNSEPVITQAETVPIDDPKRTMEVVIHTLSPASNPPGSNAQGHTQAAGPQRPAMVENLIQLMRDLGEAASSV